LITRDKITVLGTIGVRREESVENRVSESFVNSSSDDSRKRLERDFVRDSVAFEAMSLSRRKKEVPDEELFVNRRLVAVS
jgi:hypothetical protein